METKLIKVKEDKVDDKIDFYASFGYVLLEKEELEDGKVALTFERDKDRLAAGSYGKLKKGEKAYRSISRPYPLGFLIAFVIGAIFLALYFVLKQSFAFYIIFLYVALTFFGLSLYLLIIFLVLFAKRRSLLKKVVKTVAIEAGTAREYPLENNIKEEGDDTWAIAENFEF